MTEILEAMSRPDNNGAPALPKRGGPKGIMPGSWVGRGVKIEYRDAAGDAQTLAGKLLDLYPAGPIIGANGYRTLLSWDALILCELEAG